MDFIETRGREREYLVDFIICTKLFMTRLYPLDLYNIVKQLYLNFKREKTNWDEVKQKLGSIYSIWGKI